MLTTGIVYYFRVSAVNHNGLGPRFREPDSSLCGACLAWPASLKICR